MWQELKPKIPNITTKVILEPSVAMVVETHSKVDTAAIEVDNQMAFTQIQVGKNIVEDVLINGGASVNIIIVNFITKSSLPKPSVNKQETYSSANINFY